MVSMQADQNIVEYQVSPTKQAKGDSGKEPKLQQVTSGDQQATKMEKKKPWEKPGSVRGPVLLWPTANSA